MKKILSIMLSMVMFLSIVACGSAESSTDKLASSTVAKSATSDVETTEMNEVTQSSTDTDEVSEGTSTDVDAVATDSADAEGSKTLVVYFSWSGHLDSMAHWVADETGGDLVRVTTKDPYPENYNDTADRAKSEQDNDERPEINVDLTQEQLAQYDTVFFGFPVWWYDLPMCMWTFLESYDFSGKTIIPFFSHEGSSNGAGALPRIESLASGATVRSTDAISIRGGSVDGAEEEVREWARSFNK